MTAIYANISIGHENEWSVIEKRVIAAAQCNADAVIMSKSTPHLVIPGSKKYVAIETKWGTLPYLDAANRSEITYETTTQLAELCEQIGIPLIFSVTDSTAASFIKEVINPDIIKLHRDAIDLPELVTYVKQNFDNMIVSETHLPHVQKLYPNPRDKTLQVYVTTDEFPPSIQELQYYRIDALAQQGYNVGYEGREAGIFPVAALAYKPVKWIEKYLGEPDSDTASILTPEQFYDLFNTVHIMEQAYGSTHK